MAPPDEVPPSRRPRGVVPYNPGLHDLGLALLGAGAAPTAEARRLAEGYPTGALAEFTLASPWHLLEAGGGQLVRFLAPRDLPTAELELPA